MATLALGVGIAAAGGTAGISTAASIGLAALAVGASIFDQQVVFPALFPPPNTKVGGISDMQLQNTSEGSPINFCQGPTVRLGGTLLWMTDLSEDSKSKRVGGKRNISKGQKVTTLSYSTSLAIGICEGPITAVKKVWADGKLIYDDGADVAFTDTDLTASVTELYHHPQLKIQHKVATTISMDGPTSKISDTALGFITDGFIVNMYINISGFANAANNGHFKIESLNSGTLTLSGGSFVTEGAGNSISIQAADPRIRRHYLKITAPNGGTDLSEFRSGLDVVSSGWAGGGNNDTFRCAWSEAESDGSTSLYLIGDPTVVAEASGATVTLTQTVTELDLSIASSMTVHDGADSVTTRATYSMANGDNSINDSSGNFVDDGFVADMTVIISGFSTSANNGQFKIVSVVIGKMVLEGATVQTEGPVGSGTITRAQDPDSLMEANIGSGQVPGFRGIAYVVFENMQLADFGNRVPLYSFLIEKDVSITVANAIGEMFERTGRAASEYDVTGVSGSLRGHVLPGPQPLRGGISTLMFAFGLVSRSSDGVLEFLDRDSTDLITIDSDDLAARDFDVDVPRPVVVTDGTGIDLPAEVNIRFLEVALEYQQSSQRERRISVPTDSERTIDLPIVLTGAEARTIAKRALWTEWANRQTVRLTLPASYLHVQENDRISVTWEGDTHQILVKRVNRGHNFILEIDGVIEEVPAISQSASSEDPVDPTQASYTPPSLLMRLIDVAPLTNDQLLVPGFSYTAIQDDPAKVWPGAEILYSLDDATYHEAGMPIGFAGIMGESSGGFADAAGGQWDTVNTLTVKMKSGTLESHSEQDVLEGANRAIIGNEIIAFQTATLIATRTYELTTLLRGLRNTEDDTDTHEDSEIFVLLGEGGIEHKSSIAVMHIVGKARYFKIVPLGGEESNIDDVLYAQVQANNVRPFSPSHIQGTRDGSNNLTLTWIRRSRAIFRHFSSQTAPLVEDVEKYEVDVLDDTGTVLNTYETLSPLLEITAASQAALGITPGDPVTVKIYQISKIYGRGRVKGATV